MAKIGDLLLEAQSVSLSDLACDLAFYAKLGELIGRDSHVARRRFERYGAGIYTRSGWYADSESARKRIASKLGFVVIVTTDREITTYSKSDNRRNEREKLRACKARNRQERLGVLRERRSDRETRRIFDAGQFTPNRKRSGKANSHSDIGKYVDVPATRIVEESGTMYNPILNMLRKLA